MTRDYSFSILHPAQAVAPPPANPNLVLSMRSGTRLSSLSRSAQHNITPAIPAGIGKCVHALILGCRCAQPQATGYDPSGIREGIPLGSGGSLPGSGGSLRDRGLPPGSGGPPDGRGAQPVSTVTAAEETTLAWEGVEFTLSGGRHVSVMSLGTAPIPEGSQPVARGRT